jgi:hypothetical protein
VINASRALAVLLVVGAAILAASWWKAGQGGGPRPVEAAPGAALPQSSPSAPRLAGRPSPADAPHATAPTPSDAISAQLLAAHEAALAEIAKVGRDTLRGRYQVEQVDPGWAMAKEQTLARLSASGQIEQMAVGPTRFRADCRSTVCRIHADFPDRRAADDWHTLYTLAVGVEMPNVSMQRTHNPDGSVRVELYGFARPEAP